MGEQFHVGRGSYDGHGLTVFPVWLESAELHGHCWKPAHLAVSELESGASVNSLVVANASHRPIVALEGDVFAGGRQNRMLAQGLVVGRGERHEVSVACVEEGRWSGTDDHSGTSRRASFGVRFGLSDALAETSDEPGVRLHGRTRVEGRAQGEVWERIRRHEEQNGAAAGHSLLASMAAVEARTRVDLPPLTRIPGQRGVIIGIGGYIAAAEFFGGQSGLAARWDGIIAAARYEAQHGAQRETPGYQARDFTALLERTPVGDNLAVPEHVASPLGTLAVSSFALAFGLVHAAVFNGDHPVLARV